ncbi:hypothetical protein BJV74DRAFT_880718 [Russula compacta]|nr:hypothetical protein BJV74DRAFT_880718 [Russula compacta]
MQSSRRPSISLVPLVLDNNDLSEPPGHDDSPPPEYYQVPRIAVILSVTFFVVLILLAIFVALITSFVRAHESATATASDGAAFEALIAPVP